MTPRNRTHNDLLRALLKEAGWPNHNLAQAVNRVAAETGVSLCYDRTSASHWLSGTRPRPPVAAVAALGMADAAVEDPDAVPERGSGLAALHRLLAQDSAPGMRTPLRERPYRVRWAVRPAGRPGSSAATS